jgi:photosystem II stability/assembly factor-like uncharacterized protein
VGLPPRTTFLTLAVHPQSPSLVYAGTDSGVYRTQDGGGRWEAASMGLPPNQAVHTVLCHPRDPRLVYAATTTGVFKSMSGGDRWSLAMDGVTGAGPIESLAMVSQRPGSLLLSYGGQLYKSSDGAATWSLASMQSGIGRLFPDPREPDLVYALLLGGGLLKSRDGGAKFAAINSGLPEKPSIFSLAIHPQNPLILYVGAAGLPSTSLFRTVTGGE